MDERSFQKLPPVLGSHRILFKAPAVVSKKFDIPPSLVALFHNANILVKALILLFIQISTVLWKIDHREYSLTDVRDPSWRKLSCSTSISFLCSALRWFPRKFVTTDLSDCQADSSASISVLSTLGPSRGSLI